MKNAVNKSSKEKLRNESEGLLKQKSLETDPLLTEADAMKLIHELQVHQIELELQNEELKQAKLDAQVATEKYTELFDFAPLGYFLLSKTGEIIELNLYGAKMLGKERSKLKNNSFIFFIDPETKVFFNQFLDRVFSSNLKETCEPCSLSINGTQRSISLTGVATENGKNCLLTVSDITRRINAELDLKESNDKLHSLADNIPAHIAYVNAHSLQYEYVNALFVKSFGLPREKIIGSHIKEIIGESNYQFALKYIAQVKEGKKVSYENTFKLATGKRWINVTYNPIFDSSNQVVSIAVMSFDITEKRQLEESLNESILRYKLVLEGASGGVWDWDVSNKKVHYSSSWKTMRGYTDDEIGDSEEEWSSGIHPNDVSKVMASVQNHFEGKTPYYEEEYRIHCKDGSWKWILDRGVASKDDTGQVIRMAGSEIDITERKKAECELIAAKVKAEESEHLKSAFLANMSHEIRTPMNGILGFTSLLKKPDLSGENQRKYITIIEKSGARMLNIINDLISFSKVESGLMELSVIETNINEQIDYVCTFFKPEAEQKGLQIFCNTPLLSNEAIIKTDREKLYAILTNLIKNAIKFTPRGSIEIGYTKKIGILEFYVKDTGIGISETKKDIIFERFRQANESLSRDFEGAGLGLSISKAFLELLGGKIWVESAENIGSTFYFTLPYSMGEHDIVDENDSLPIANLNNIRTLKVLIAEDDKISRLLLSELFEMNDNEILFAKTGTEAVQVCRDNPDLDLILMDIQMPEMNGHEASRQIRNFNKNVIIIAQTAFSLHGDKEKAIEAGCNDYIPKPIDYGKLNEMLKKYFPTY